MAVVGSDNFDRINDGNLGANWTEPGGGLGFSITSNTATADDQSSDCIAIFTATPAPNDGYVQGKVSVVSTAADTGMGICYRADSTGANCYKLVVNHAASNNIVLQKFFGAAYTLLGNRTQAWTDGDTLRLEVTGSGPVTLKAFRNGTQLGADFTDNTDVVPSGSAGLTISSTITGAGSFVDDFEFGTIDAPPSDIPVVGLESLHGRMSQSVVRAAYH